jgi:hypothetical protein
MGNTKMKPSILFVSLSILALLVISEGVSTVHAQTLTKDFGISNVQSENGSIECSYNVTLNIQTEPNGDWICGNTYHVSWVITLTYVNHTMFNGFNDFTITFYQSFPTEINATDFIPQFTFASAILRPTLYSVANGSVPKIRSVAIGSVATLSVAFTAFDKPEDFQFDFAVDYSITNNGEPAYYPVPGESVITYGEWLQNTPLYINIVSQKNPLQIISNPSFIQEIYFSAVVIVIIIGVYAYIKKGKKPLLHKPLPSEFPTLISTLPLCLSVFSVAVILRHRKTANLKL